MLKRAAVKTQKSQEVSANNAILSKRVVVVVLESNIKIILLLTVVTINRHFQKILSSENHPYPCFSRSSQDVYQCQFLNFARSSVTTELPLPTACARLLTLMQTTPENERP